MVLDRVRSLEQVLLDRYVREQPLLLRPMEDFLSIYFATMDHRSVPPHVMCPYLTNPFRPLILQNSLAIRYLREKKRDRMKEREEEVRLITDHLESD